MSRLISPILLLSIFIVFYSCHKDDELPTFFTPEEEEYEYDCVFEQIDNTEDGLIDSTEKLIMSECIANEFTSISEIQDSLIGNWELIGHGEGWVVGISQPCAFITVTAEELTLDYTSLLLDTVATYKWEIEEVNWAGGKYFQLNTLPDSHEGLFITHFSEQYMFGDGTPADGRMHLYEKVD